MAVTDTDVAIPQGELPKPSDPPRSSGEGSPGDPDHQIGDASDLQGIFGAGIFDATLDTTRGVSLEDNEIPAIRVAPGGRVEAPHRDESPSQTAISAGGEAAVSHIEAVPHAETAPGAQARPRRKPRRERRKKAPGSKAAGASPKSSADRSAVQFTPTAAETVSKDQKTQASPEPGRRSRHQRQEPPRDGRAAAQKSAKSEDGTPARKSRAPRSTPGVSRRILINATDDQEVRIAVLEDGRLEELQYERAKEEKYLGNIYKGRIVNLEPAIQAAFVDLGIGRNGFLHVSDVLPIYKDATSIPIDSLSQRLPDRRRLKIQEILRKGQEVLVQISKDSIGAKGPSLTTYISVPGKYLVLMPGVNRFGVSKRIQDGAERADLREKLTSLSPPPGMGYIVRTAGQERSVGVLEKELRNLMATWDEIRSRVLQGTSPSTIYTEVDLVIRAMRDLFGADVDEILIDKKEVYDRARKFLLEVMPQAARRVKRYSGTTPLFSRFGVEEQIGKIYNRRVPLPSGGYLVIEQTEALVAIDVNSGKYRDELDLEATALKTNLEAADEIGRQLRLRDLGGVIINDFIDMEAPANRRKVEQALRAALKNDRAKCWMTKITRFGIIEMTRQRVRPSFERTNYQTCPVCKGRAVIKSARSTGMGILRELRGTIASKRRQICEIRTHHEVASYLLNERRQSLLELEAEFHKTIVVIAEPSFQPEHYDFKWASTSISPAGNAPIGAGGHSS